MESGLLEYVETYFLSVDRYQAGHCEGVVTTAPIARRYGQQGHKL
jgi:hypothetical protein